MRIPILILLLIFLGSCALLKKDRVKEHNGIKRNDFNLPIFLYPSALPKSKKLLILLSGDGGWIKFEDDLSQKFAEKGFNTVGFNSRSYFWTQRNPEQTRNDILLLIRKYSSEFNAHEIYLCGYSFGADIIPFIYNRLPWRTKKRVHALELLSPYATTDFRIHLSDLTNLSKDNKNYRVDREVERLSLQTFCFYGVDESNKALKNIKNSFFHVAELKGEHRYEAGELDRIVSAIDLK